MRRKCRRTLRSAYEGGPHDRGAAEASGRRIQRVFELATVFVVVPEGLPVCSRPKILGPYPEQTNRLAGLDRCEKVAGFIADALADVRRF